MAWTLAREPQELAARLTMAGLRGRGAGAGRAAASRRRRRRDRRARDASRRPTSCSVCKVEHAARRPCRSSAARQCARRPEGAARHGRREAAGRHGDQDSEAARRRVVRHAVLGAGARPRRRRRAASLELPPMRPWARTCAPTCSLDDAILELNVTPNRGDCMSRARHRARSRGADRRSRSSRSDARASAARRRRRHFPGAAARRARAARASRPRDPRHRQPGAQSPLLDAGAPASRGPAPDQPGGRRHELRDARARPADARLRPARSSTGGIACACARAGETLTLLDGTRDRRSTSRCAGHRRRTTEPWAWPASWAATHSGIGDDTTTCCSRSRSSRRTAIAGRGAPLWPA